MRTWMLCLALISLMSCQKAQRDEDTATNTCEDINLAQTIFADAYKQVRIVAKATQGIGNGDSIPGTIYGCEEIIVDTLSNTRSIIIDYKYIGCEGMGAARYGRIQSEFFGKFGEEGSAVDIIFSNYFFEEFEVNGKIRVIFKERNSSDQEVHTFYLQDGGIFDGESNLSWTASQTWTVTDNGNNPEEFSFSGSSNGINRKGNTFKAEITTDNEMSEDCLYVRRGVRKVDVKNLSRRTLNFGSGSCSGSANVTINGTDFGIGVGI